MLCCCPAMPDFARILQVMFYRYCPVMNQFWRIHVNEMHPRDPITRKMLNKPVCTFNRKYYAVLYERLFMASQANIAKLESPKYKFTGYKRPCCSYQVSVYVTERVCTSDPAIHLTLRKCISLDQWKHCHVFVIAISVLFSTITESYVNKDGIISLERLRYYAIWNIKSVSHHHPMNLTSLGSEFVKDGKH